jgi:hypothetical protein
LRQTTTKLIATWGEEDYKIVGKMIVMEVMAKQFSTF